MLAIKSGELREEDKKLCADYLEELRSDCLRHREYDENNSSREEGAFQRDYTRIMYAASFRRLQGKMQLLGLRDSEFYRNRLTHSLEVAQIARSIAYKLGYTREESFVVEAGALAHDIGNPPFGHAGENVLNQIYSHIGGFEGNAQTLRILRSVERKRPKFQGLNLTWRTQLAVVKYFAKAEGGSNKKFIYNDDYKKLSAFITENNINLRTLDVQIVDIADEIAYAAHDLEDGLRVKAFTIDDILQEFWNKCITEDKNKLSKDAFKLFETLVTQAKESSGYKRDKFLTSSAYLHLFGMELESKLIHTAIENIGLINVDAETRNKTKTVREKELGFVDTAVDDMVHGLKDIVFECINHNSDVFHYEQEGKKVLRFLTDFYKDTKKKQNIKYLPPEYRASEWKKLGIRADQERLTCDYIAGMMDYYAIEQYEKYSGRKFKG